MNEVVRRFPNVFTVDPSRYIDGPGDQQDAIEHLDRMVYFNIYKELVEQFTRRSPPISEASPAAAEREAEPA
ncbi:hypothetical protein [Bradyrhizobium sp. STM 3562]|uniref:hypothetical protein n=1 Tax=Bradyrhizobium sp. STM 3562 TaxID=578924 RepID=UPI0038910795